MNVIFLTIHHIENIQSRGIYTDLMRKFRDEGHNVFIVCPYERRYGLSTSLKEVDNVHILGVKTLNVQKTNIVEKGIGTILLENLFCKAIKKYVTSISFDLILYSTPPITFVNVVEMLKRKNPKAVSYLLLKDIFPQNAVDLGLFSKQSLFYKYFRRKEVNLYRASDYIGCMSPANVDFVVKHNDYVPADRVMVAPNSIELEDETVIERKTIRSRYNLPIDKPVFIYGGNLGKPQGVDFLIKCMEANKERTDCSFLIVGNGTEYEKLERWYEYNKNKNIVLLKSLPKKEYDELVHSCDVGLIFLDHRFTIPNYPSRLLSYLEYKMPVIAATDMNTDIGKIAEDNEYGFWCESVDVNAFTECVDKYTKHTELISVMGRNGYQFLRENYLINNTYNAIVHYV